MSNVDDFDVSEFFNNDPLARQLLNDEEDSKKQNINEAIDKICAFSPQSSKAQSVEIPLASIDVFEQVRKYFDETELSELTESIRENGLLSPITVCKKGNDRYRLICGERRYRACKKLGFESIKANILELEAKEGISVDAQITVLQIIENLQRSDPTLTDYIDAVSNLLSLEPDISKEKISKLISKSVDYVSRLQEVVKFTSQEKTIILPLGIKFIQNVYLPLKNNFSKEALAFVNKAEAYLLKVDNRTPQINEELKEQGKKLYADCKKQRDRSISKSTTATPKRAKFAISLASLNKKKDKLGDRLQMYLQENDADFEETVASALDRYLSDYNI